LRWLAQIGAMTAIPYSEVITMQDGPLHLAAWLLDTIEVMATLFILAVGVFMLWVVAAYIIDVTQTRHAVRHNYPVIGRFRYLMEHLGEFFRQYFFAMDREELPFNRAQRSWVYRAAKNENNTVAFGSTRDLRSPGSVVFVNTPFPTLGEDAVPPQPVTIGPDCAHPYTTASLFNISGMSFGAISQPAVLALSNGAKQAGIWLNTGEGGLSPYHLEGGADIVFQIGTAKHGVRDLEGKLSDDKLRQLAAYPQVRMFEIKLSQGAKPGKGGILPGSKVTEEVATIRGLRVGEDAHSPNRHPEINNYADLLAMIGRVRGVTGKPTGCKTVLGNAAMLDGLLSEINRQGVQSAPDFITLDGAEGGSGAAPMPLIDSVGLPLREALPMLVDKLCEYGLRERIKVIASGKLINPGDVAWALCLGADFVTNARGFMFALGCIQAMQCNKNTCPTGVTTHNEKLQQGLDPVNKAERVVNYARNMMLEVGMIAHACGARSPSDLTREHARVVTAGGVTRPLNEIYPVVSPRPSS
jgi:glutamate synthase domain-containing protein 2